jgi:membrane protein DedA with SNARE-associated domain
MTWTDLIATHGYWLLALGCFLEGETILVLAGVAARLGYLNPLAVLGIAVGCGFAGDQFFFWLGRHSGTRILARWPALAQKAQPTQRLIERYDTLVVVMVRFVYGMRIAGPIFIGMSGIPWWRLIVFNFLGAVVWACAVAGAGWLLGEGVHVFLDHVHSIQAGGLLAVVLLGLVIWWVRRRRRR